ncbi:hypothetical protein [Clostridium beijerinckii]|uniref:Uncharacterized protein n=1 Tax=Clostridium beijerinckii TaxID=1520 RepID=A0A1S8S7J2_CLOBE|nr:hypothetical protein [Clostridium beijerinckii]NRY61495.1 hypothetical protein [Clostridium beijerinckii]OOM61282.1 hypothetical protein CLBCK_24160 [Clostridium beijerinckii]
MKINNFCIGQTKNNGCKKLTVDKCIGESCSFAQNKEQVDASKKRSFERLTNLSQERQSHIAEKYYGGKMPWLKGGV